MGADNAMSDGKQISIVCPHCRTEYRVSTDISGKMVTCKRCGKTFAASENNNVPTPHLGLLAVKYNLITREQLADALSFISNQKSEENRAPLESVLMERGLLTEAQIETLKATELLGKVSQMSRQFGALAVEKSILSEEVLKAAFEKQAVLFKKTKIVRHVKDILLEEGHLGKADHDLLLNEMNASVSEQTESVKTGAGDETEPTAEVRRNFELIISEDRMSVELRAKADPPAAISPVAVRRLLKAEGVSHGIIEDKELESLLSSLKEQGAAVVVARGMPPNAGEDAALKYHFAKDQKVGTMGTHGEIDFKNKGEVPFVHQGDLLIEKIPAVPCSPGHDVMGNELKPTAPSDVKLLFGPGVELSEDRLKLYAKADGQPKLSLGGRLSVVTDLVISGDVDLKTGHIDFEGNVKVTGTIQSGFKVKGANVEAKEIMGAQITALGDITTTGGIIGAVVKAQGTIKAKYIKHATMSTFGDIIVQKEITDSNINTSGACVLARGKILSSEISAKQGIEAVDIGTDVSSPCKLTVGVDDHVEAEIEGLLNAIRRREDRLLKIKEEISSLDQEQQKIHKEIADLAQIQDRSLVKQRALKQKLDELSEEDSEKRQEFENAVESLGKGAQDAEASLGNLFDKQDDLAHKTEKMQHEAEQVKDDICELKNELEAIRHWAKSQKKTATIKVSGAVVQGTLIGGPHTRTVLKETVRHVAIREVKNTDSGSAVEYEIKLQSS